MGAARADSGSATHFLALNTTAFTSLLPGLIPFCANQPYTYAEMVTVEFDECRFAEYSFKELEELELAYALTVHKAQGSEYPAVILPLLNGPRMLMNRNLLYTAVTRARSCVTIVGSPYAVNQMIDNKYEQIRYTSLRQRICEFVL